MVTEVFGQKIEIWFTEYNSKTKKQKVIEDLPVTRQHRNEIAEIIDDTGDGGTFFEFTSGNVSTRGHFSIEE